MRSLALVLLPPTLALAAPNDWAEGPGDTHGASRDYYNSSGALAWDNYMGDWHDAADTPQGDVAYATTSVADDDTGKWVEWDVTALVQEWTTGATQNKGVFLRPVSGPGPIDFRTKEHATTTEHPELVIVATTGSGTLAPEADTYLEPSTYRSQGESDRMRVGSNNSSLLRFDVTGITGVTSASLRLWTYQQFGGGSTDIGAFACNQGHDEPPSGPILGIAAAYTDDFGIAGDPAVIFFADFEADTWADAWTSTGSNRDPVDSDPTLGFAPLQGRALRVTMAQGANAALNMTYKFMDETGSEPEEIYFRYYLRFANTWDQTVDGGKMPGISGTYGVAGWGGRPVDGTNGWSARGAFHESIPAGNPLAGRHPIGYYCYHADMTGNYGNVWLWQNDYRGFLRNDEWHSVEEYVQMNTPGVNDGILRAWIDGRLAYEKTDLRFRDVTALKVEQIWMNIYHGGTDLSPYDQHAYIDNVVVASEYIGPMPSTVVPDTTPPAPPTGLAVQ